MFGAYGQQTGTGTSVPVQSGAPPAFGNVNPNAEGDALQAKMARQRNTLRQQEIGADSNQLLKLAQQLKEQVDKSNQVELSLSVVKTAQQIEKLAKSIDKEMRAETLAPGPTDAP